MRMTLFLKSEEREVGKDQSYCLHKKELNLMETKVLNRLKKLCQRSLNDKILRLLISLIS